MSEETTDHQLKIATVKDSILNLAWDTGQKSQSEADCALWKGLKANQASEVSQNPITGASF